MIDRIVRRRHAGLALAGIVVTLVAIVVMADPAAAHGNVVATEPAAGAVVQHLDRIVLRFEEPVEVVEAHLWLQDDDGAYTLGPATHLDGDSRAITVAVPAVASSRYLVGYHIVSDDGDVASGSFGFTLDTPPVNGAAPEPLPPAILGIEATPSAALHQDHGSDLPGGTARVLLDASLASLIGGLAFIVTVWPQGASFASTRLLLWAAALVAALTSLDLAVIQHASAEGLSLVSALAPSHLVQSLQFRFGRIAAARLVLLTIAAALTTRLSRGGALTARSARWCAAACAVAIGLFETVVLLGHDGRSGALAEGARLVHTLGVSIWLGGLVMLFVVVLPRRSTEELLAVLPRFSAMATAAVASLLVGGVALSIELVGAANALPTTSYGRVLILKLVVVAVLLVAASRSRDVVRQRLVRASSQRVRLAAAGPIATWIGIELALMTVVLALTALLVSSTPPA